MLLSNKDKNFAVAYIYKKGNLDFLDDIADIKPYIEKVFLVNFSEEQISAQDKDIKIIKPNSESLKSLVQSIKKYNIDYLLILQENEKLIIKTSLKTILESLDDEIFAYGIQIKPSNYEYLEFHEEQFITIESRLLNIRTKFLNDFYKTGDIFYKKELKLIFPENFFIQQKNINSEIEIIKTNDLLDMEKITQREFLFLGNSYFYKDSKIAEEYYKKGLEFHEENSEYKEILLSMLLKLFLRKQNFAKIKDLLFIYKDLEIKNPLYWVYVGNYYFEVNDIINSLKSFHKALKYKENIPFIYNNSDINWKLYYKLGLIFFGKKYFNHAEKYFTLTYESMSKEKYPELYINLAKTKFNNEKYNDAFEVLKEIFHLEKVEQKILQESKYTMLNLLLFADFREEFIEILSKDIFDKTNITRIADSLFMAGSYENALNLYLLITKKFETDKELLFKIGYICSILKYLEMATIYFKKYLEIEPENLDALSNLAFIYLNLENLELAEKIYLKILDLNNFSFEANLYLSMIYISKENKEKASLYINKARTLNPLSPEIIKLYQIFSSNFK